MNVHIKVIEPEGALLRRVFVLSSPVISTFNWRKILPEMNQAGALTVVMDLPGFGQSACGPGAPQDNRTRASLAWGVIDEIDAGLGEEGAWHLMGHGSACQVLMDMANKNGGLVIGTGDLSELALGWATYNGDHMSMYGVNVSVPKTLVRYLVDYEAETTPDPELRAVLKDILDTLVDLKKINYYFEHYIERSRHIEVQIVADNYGEVIHLGERECSIQRRNQKLLEESPSIALTHEMRKQVGTLAVKAAKSVHYSNVGTVEFLLDLKDNQFYFMEINPRIQVEHGVTEEVTGIDIVRTQIRIAAGEPLDITQADVHFQGHAIECRINAEDPDNNFMPSPGQITFLHEPSGPRVRFDSGVTAGLSIEPYYDSMIAKLIVHGRTRGDAIKIMQRALKEFRIDGVKTTISLHQKILSDSYFRTGNIDTQFIKKRIATYEAQKENGKNYLA